MVSVMPDREMKMPPEFNVGVINRKKKQRLSADLMISH